MNPAHLHLILNHAPVMGALFGLGLLLAARLRKSDELLKAAFVVLILTGLAAAAAYFTGEPAEDWIAKAAGVAQPMIEEHEEAATLAFGFSAAAGLLSMGGLFILARARAIPRWGMIACIVASLVAAMAMARTAYLGGQIRHEEARPK